jgi:Acyl-CoA dehydrogenase, C-terminal domain
VMPDTTGDTVADLVRNTIRSVVSDRAGSSVMTGLRELGWDGLVAQDEQLAVGALFEEQGRLLSTSVALDDVIVRAANLRGDRVALPVPPDAALPSARLEDGALVVEGLLLATGGGFDGSDRIVVPARWRDSIAFGYVSASNLDIRSIDGIDPSLGLARVSGTVEHDALDDADSTHRWNDALAAARRALAHELIGAVQMMLDLATEHARTRVQFGAPIGAHQAIKFPLADVFVALNAARFLVVEAWSTPSLGASGPAKAAAASAGLGAIEHCHQAMGAMGFTWEFPMHHFTRRVYALDALLGDATALDHDHGSRIMTTGAAPRIGDL